MQKKNNKEKENTYYQEVGQGVILWEADVSRRSNSTLREESS